MRAQLRNPTLDTDSAGVLTAMLSSSLSAERPLILGRVPIDCYDKQLDLSALQGMRRTATGGSSARIC